MAVWVSVIGVPVFSRPLRPRNNGPDLGLVHVNMLTPWQGSGANPSHLALAYKGAGAPTGRCAERRNGK
jgi:hypothetical protein